MTATHPVFRRILRRETHSPRTVATIIVVVLLIVALLYAGVEIVLALASQPPLLVEPAAAMAWLIALPTLQPASAVIASAAVLALLGLLLILAALGPGRLARHEMTWQGRAVVVDNGVIASSLAQHISGETGIARNDITVGVSHRKVDVTVKPGAGLPFDAAPLQQLIDDELGTYRLAPPMKTRLRISRPQESDLADR